MKTLNNLFGKSTSVKNIYDFNHFSMNSSQMNAIKGGTQPIETDPTAVPSLPPSGRI